MADRYWVGGTATWDGTAGTKWATTSGGTGGASVPTSADDVFLNAASGTVNVSLSLSSSVCRSLNCTGFTGTLVFTSTTFSVHGGIIFSTTMTLTNPGTATVNLLATSGSFSITSNGKTFPGVTTLNIGVALNGSTAAISLADAINVSTLNVRSGTFNTSNFSASIGSISNSSGGTINFGSSTVTLSGTLPIAFTGTSQNFGTSQINISNAGPTFSGGNRTFFNVSFTSTSPGTRTVNGTNTFNNLTFANRSTSGASDLVINASQVINGTFTISGGGSASRRIFAAPSTYNSPITITCAAASLTDADFRDITFSGAAAPVSGTRLGNCGGNSNITFPAAKTVYWNLTGGGSWGSTAWATLISGTPADANFPLAQDIATFVTAGLNTSATVTIDGAWNIGSVDMSGRGSSMTLSGSSNPFVFGNWTNSSNISFNGTGVFSFAARNTTQTIISAGRTFTQQFNILCYGGSVVLGDAFNTSNSFTLTAGTLNLANFTLSTGIFGAGGSATKAIAFGSGNIALTSVTASTTILSANIISGFSWTGTGGFTRNQAATATISWGNTAGGSPARAVNLSVTAGASALTISAGSFVNNLNFTGSTCTVTCLNLNVYGNFTLATGGTYTSVAPTFAGTNTITSSGKTIGATLITGSSGIIVTLADALTTSTFTFNQGTINLANFTLSTGTFSSSSTLTRAITFGSGNIALTSTTAAATVLNMAVATGFTFTGTGGFTRNMAATATVVFGTTGGTTSNAPNLTVNAGASALTITGNSWWKNLNFTGSTSTVTAANQNFAGNITLGGGTYTSVGGTIFASGTITCAGKTLGGTGVPLSIDGSGITVDLGDAFSGQSVTLTQGTFTTNNFNVTTAAFFQGSNSNTRALNMGSSTFSIGGGWAFSTSTGMTLNAGTSTISMTSASAKTFAGGGLTYYNLNQGGAGALTISGSNTFNNITNTLQPSTVTFTAGLTQTVSNFSLAGTAGNLVTINSATPGSQFTLSKASGTVNAQYLSIQDSIATGGATWNALTSNGNVDAGNNTGWIFAAVAVTGNMFLMFI